MYRNYQEMAEHTDAFGDYIQHFEEGFVPYGPQAYTPDCLPGTYGLQHGYYSQQYRNYLWQLTYEESLQEQSSEPDVGSIPAVASSSGEFYDSGYPQRPLYTSSNNTHVRRVDERRPSRTYDRHPPNYRRPHPYDRNRGASHENTLIRPHPDKAIIIAEKPLHCRIADRFYNSELKGKGLKWIMCETDRKLRRFEMLGHEVTLPRDARGEGCRDQLSWLWQGSERSGHIYVWVLPDGKPPIAERSVFADVYVYETFEGDYEKLAPSKARARVEGNVLWREDLKRCRVTFR